MYVVTLEVLNTWCILNGCVFGLVFVYDYSETKNSVMFLATYEYSLSNRAYWTNVSVWGMVEIVSINSRY